MTVTVPVPVHTTVPVPVHTTVPVPVPVADGVTGRSYSSAWAMCNARPTLPACSPATGDQTRRSARYHRLSITQRTELVQVAEGATDGRAGTQTDTLPQLI